MDMSKCIAVIDKAVNDLVLPKFIDRLIVDSPEYLSMKLYDNIRLCSDPIAISSCGFTFEWKQIYWMLTATTMDLKVAGQFSSKAVSLTNKLNKILLLGSYKASLGEQLYNHSLKGDAFGFDGAPYALNRSRYYGGKLRNRETICPARVMKLPISYKALAKKIETRFGRNNTGSASEPYLAVMPRTLFSQLWKDTPKDKRVKRDSVLNCPVISILCQGVEVDVVGSQYCFRNIFVWPKRYTYLYIYCEMGQHGAFVKWTGWKRDRTKDVWNGNLLLIANVVFEPWLCLKISLK